MDDLPLELKQRVCSYLKPKDLKSLRSTSKLYAAATDRYLLLRIFLSNHPDSFQEIQIITDHPQLRHSVTTLVVDTSCLPLFPKYEKWAKFFVDDKSESGKQTVTRAERALRRERNHEQWTKYQQHAMAQRSSKGIMLNSIALAFQKCPKLSNLIIECYGQHNSDFGAEEKQDRYYHDIHPVPTVSRYRLWRLESMRLDIWDILKPVHDVERMLSSLVLLDKFVTCSRNWTMPTTTIFQTLKHLRHLGSYSNFFKQIVARAPELQSIGILGSPNTGGL